MKEVIPLLEAVALIGRTLAGGGDPVADLINPPPRKPPKVETIYLVKLNFRMGAAGPLAVDMQEIDDIALIRYRWVGNEKGNRPQFYLTTDQLKYLVGQAPVNLLARLEEAGLENGSLYRRLSALVKSFFRELPDGSRVLDPQRLGLATEDVLTATWEENTGKPQERAKAVVAAVAEVAKKWALEQLELKAAEAALWTVLVDNVPLVADPDYAHVLLRGKEAAVDKGEPGVCSVCGAEDRLVTPDFTQLSFLKYYINDKLGAASGVAEEGFARNFQACRDCFRGLLLAERFVQDRLGLRVGRLSFLVLPAFLREPDLSRTDLEFWVEKLKTRVEALSNTSGWIESLAGLKGLDDELQDLLEDMPYENAALLNFLFYHYQGGRSEFRVLFLIKDVAPSRIARLLRHSHRLADQAAALLGPDRWWLDLTAIYRIIPLSEGPRGVEYKKLLHIYHGLLTGAPLDRAFLIREFVALARVYQTGNYAGTNVPPPKAGAEEWEWTRRLLQANLFLKFLQEENLLRGGRSLSTPLELETVLLPEEMRAYLAAMAYDGPETALFLLGYLLNQVGQKQRDRGYESKPVLEKVNYAGMPWAKVVRLANILVDQLRQNDILKYHEGLFAVMKKLFDAHRPGAHQREWPLSPEENVFYILSGYAYGTRMALKAWAEKQNAKKQDADEGGADQ